MNLEFAMDLPSVRHAILKGNIALSPIRGIGKTSTLLDVIEDTCYTHLRVAIVAPHKKQCVFISQTWEARNRARAIPKLYFYSSGRELADRMRGIDHTTPIFFDEYMDFQEYERTEFYKLRDVLNFCGGTATFRG